MNAVDRANILMSRLDTEMDHLERMVGKVAERVLSKIKNNAKLTE